LTGRSRREFVSALIANSSRVTMREIRECFD
jgi:hypothetical protein